MDNLFPCIIGVVEGMRWPREPLNLTPTLQIRTAHSKERFFVEDLVRSNQKAGRTLDFPLLDRDSCLIETSLAEEALLRVRYSVESLPRVAEENFVRPLTLLRLFKTGALGIRYVLVPLSAERSAFAVRESDSLRAARHEFGRSSYDLEAEEAEQLRTWMQLNWPADLIQRPEVRWWHKAYQETSTYDWVYHIALAMEQILFRADGDRDNLRYKFSLKGAWLLGNDFTSRREIFRDLRKIYDLRSLILHGSKTGPFDRNEFGLLERTEEYLRRMMALTFCKLQSPDHAALDERILAGIGPGDPLPMPAAPSLNRPREQPKEEPPRPSNPQDRDRPPQGDFSRHRGGRHHRQGGH